MTVARVAYMLLSLCCAAKSSAVAVSTASCASSDSIAGHGIELLQKTIEVTPHQVKQLDHVASLLSSSLAPIQDEHQSKTVEELQPAAVQEKVGSNSSWPFLFERSMSAQLEYEMASTTMPVKNKILLVLIEGLAFGMCGIDRCYMGQTCLGIIKGLTFGGLGLWALIDYVIVMCNCLASSPNVQLFGLNATFVDWTASPAFWIAAAFIITKLIGTFTYLCSGSKEENEPESAPSPYQTSSVPHASMAVGSLQQTIDSGKGAEDVMYTAFVVVAWFVLGIALANFTKWTFVYGEVCIDNHCEPYKFPLTITVVHMVFSWALCHIYIFYIRSGPQRVIFSFRQQLQKVAPLAACFALSIAMGNEALKYIYPSFNQMLGAATPLITVLFSIPMGKRYNRWTWLSMPIICGGLVIYSAKEGTFNWLGAFFATGATVLRAVKTIIQGKLLVDSAEKVDPVTLLYYMAPFATCIVLVAALSSEGLKPFRMLDPRLLAMGAVEGSSTGNGTVMLLLLAGGMNACLVNIASFVVTAYTSPLTLQVLGNVRTCLSVVVSVAIFGNALRPLQGVGVIICLLGVWVYQRYGGAIVDSAPLPSNTDLKAVRVGQPPTAEKVPLAASEELLSRFLRDTAREEKQTKDKNESKSRGGANDE